MVPKKECPKTRAYQYKAEFSEKTSVGITSSLMKLMLTLHFFLYNLEIQVNHAWLVSLSWDSPESNNILLIVSRYIYFS